MQPFWAGDPEPELSGMSRASLARTWAGKCTGERNKHHVLGMGKAWQKEIMRDRPEDARSRTQGPEASKGGLVPTK